MKTPKVSFRFGTAILAMFFAVAAPVSLKAEVITVWGTISNNVYYADGPRQMVRLFEASFDGFDSSVFITNLTPQLLSSQTTWKAGNRFYYFQISRPDDLGAVSNTSGARFDHSQIPYLDNTFNECAWLAFGSHSYFTQRTNDSALPIWPTGLRQPGNESKIGTRSIYTALKDSFFPSEVAYITDGFRHFEGVTMGILQGIQLLPPLDRGFTNYIGRTITTTNFEGKEVPLQFEIFRYGPVVNGPGAFSELKPLLHSVIDVSAVASRAGRIDYPALGSDNYFYQHREVVTPKTLRQRLGLP